MIHDLSFDPNDRIFKFNDIEFAVQIFTFENVYGLDAGRCKVYEDSSCLEIECDRLTWAGGQEFAEGYVNIKCTKTDKGSRIGIDAKAEKSIRCVKLLLKNQPVGTVINLIGGVQKDVPDNGMILKYPEGWRTLSTPLMILRSDEGKLVYFRSLDTRVRDKRFALLKRKDRLDIELIYEEIATETGTKISVPEWEIGTCGSIGEIYRIHTDHIEKSYGLVPWEERDDVPSWAKQISLIVSVHCQHWTGYIFNNYAKVLDTIKWFCERIEPKRILVYLPGWEGRYYWKYGNYCPDDRMGGSEGFDKLIKGAKELGVHVMPMFGINIVNRGLENYEEWGAPSEFRGPSGNIYGGSVDWDGSRHYDHGSNASLNPAAPKWQNRLVEQITGLIDRYGFDGVFLDIAAVWVNDPNHYLYDGILKLIKRLKEGRPELLIAGEAWYDGLAAAFPLIQSGHTDGPLNWHDEPYPEIFDKYNRAFAHLLLGDPGRGSTGVHELGYNAVWRTPVRKGIIPTVTVVEDTLEKAPEKVEEIISDAKKYAAMYLAD